MKNVKEQTKMTNQAKRFQLSNEDNCLVYEGNNYWWYTDYDICRDWWLEYEEMDNNRLFNFVNRVAAGFEMDEDEASMLLVFILCCTLDDDYLNYYLNNENEYPKDFRNFLKKYKFSIIPD